MNRSNTPNIPFRSLAAALAVASLLSTVAQADMGTSAEDTAYYLCGGCHGPQNVRVDQMAPRIIGQKKTYMTKQLKSYRDNKRHHPYMNKVLTNFTDQDIELLSDYFSSYKDPSILARNPPSLTAPAAGHAYPSSAAGRNQNPGSDLHHSHAAPASSSHE